MDPKILYNNSFNLSISIVNLLFSNFSPEFSTSPTKLAMFLDSPKYYCASIDPQYSSPACGSIYNSNLLLRSFDNLSPLPYSNFNLLFSNLKGLSISNSNLFLFTFKPCPLLINKP